MRRVFAFLLLCVLPLQVSWAMAGAYCAHEQDRITHHFGHHQDPDHKNVGKKVQSEKSTAPTGVDHSHCHLAGHVGLVSECPLPALTSVYPPGIQPELFHKLLLPDRHQRPKWFTAA